MVDNIYTLDDFFFPLHDDLIAQHPSCNRDDSKLLILDRKKGAIKHVIFKEVKNYLREGDVLVFNNAKVLNARLFFTRESGALIELILLKNLNENIWTIISNRTKRLRIGEKIYSIVDPAIFFKIIGKSDNQITIHSSIELNYDLLEKIGKLPLPPYIKREADHMDSDRYQTVYATSVGSIAAPTAGLHFTEQLLNEILNIGVNIVYLTLNVSWGTFQPVRVKDLSKHMMHSETFVLPDVTAEKVNSARMQGKRIIAVGTTSLRVLEATFKKGFNVPCKGETDIFIYPPYKIKSIDSLITNFHTPYSTLLMLVCSFAGYETLMKSYRDAIKLNYRFFSYGDSMLIF